MGIVVIGSTFVDVKGYPLGQFIPTGRNAGRIVEVHGGVCRNIAEDIANAGFGSALVTVVDESGTSTGVIERLDRRGCDTRYIRRVEGGLGTWLAIFDETGDVAASISRRPDLTEIEHILDECGDEIFASADGVAVELDIEEPILRRILTLAERHGTRVFSPVSNMSIATERREALGRLACLVCNQQEAGILFGEDYEGLGRDEMRLALARKATKVGIPSMVVTMGVEGSVYASSDDQSGWCPACKVDVVDTTGAGDAFFAGVTIGLTHGKDLAEACEVGTRLAASVIVTDENVCPRLSPEELGIDESR